MTEFEKYIEEQFTAAGIEISPKQCEQFVTLYEFMVEYNEKVNLTAITDFKEVVVKHFIDSVMPFCEKEPMVELEKGSSFIDVGTGAGFPSLPLLIMRLDLKGTLCDSLRKRCDYLVQACEKIGIKAEVIHARAEELAQKRREKYDMATARAVAALPTLAEYCVPFVKVEGMFVALKSVNEDPNEAASALEKLGADFVEVFEYKLPNGDDRRVIIMEKFEETPKKYPRSAKNIKAKPL